MACQTDADCVLFCPRGSDCCGEPCTCEQVAHRVAAEEFRTLRDRSCATRTDIECPVADCDNTPDPKPVCRKNQCVAKPVRR